MNGAPDLLSKTGIRQTARFAMLRSGVGIAIVRSIG
jgi:hypothetical protein